jgi:hypothetical protein
MLAEMLLRLLQDTLNRLPQLKDLPKELPKELPNHQLPGLLNKLPKDPPNRLLRLKGLPNKLPKDPLKGLHKLPLHLLKQKNKKI